MWTSFRVIGKDSAGRGRETRRGSGIRHVLARRLTATTRAPPLARGHRADSRRHGDPQRLAERARAGGRRTFPSSTASSRARAPGHRHRPPRGDEPYQRPLSAMGDFLDRLDARPGAGPARPALPGRSRPEDAGAQRRARARVPHLLCPRHTHAGCARAARSTTHSWLPSSPASSTPMSIRAGPEREPTPSSILGCVTTRAISSPSASPTATSRMADRTG